MLSQGRQNTCIDVFAILPKFLENLLESENLVFIDTDNENCSMYPPALVQLLLHSISFQGTWNTLFQGK